MYYINYCYTIVEKKFKTRIPDMKHIIRIAHNINMVAQDLDKLSQNYKRFYKYSAKVMKRSSKNQKLYREITI